MAVNLPRLLLVSDRQRERRGALRTSIRAGAPFVQIREKDLGSAAITERLAALACTRQGDARTGPLVCVNGQPELARRLGIGLHLPADHPPADRQGIVLLGRSVHDTDEIMRAQDERVDYLIVGTLFASASKPGRAPLGLAAFERLVRAAEPLPVFGIGGIGPDQVAAVRDAGAHGVAVCGAILEAADPSAATRLFLEELSR
ncbi:MAG: thiamine phosphate synthase [Gammaproteobacteria bacterium]|nr:MAG: thiamine phosphate synthase [Gammaproteobacteria bacterium]